MHTKTSKAILTPLADAVSTLIVIIAEAEISGHGTPDLSELSKVVVTQIMTLLQIARKIGNSTTADKQLRESMPMPCNVVSDASELLLKSTGELSKAPKSSAGRGMLLEAVKGILRGTTDILYVHDDSEVRKILNSSKHVRSLIADLDTTPTKDTAKQHVALLSQLAQAIIPLLQFSTKRISEITAEALQFQLRQTVEFIVTESPNLLNSAKTFLVEPSNADGKKLLQNNCERIVSLTKTIDMIVQSNLENGLEVADIGLFKETLDKRRKMGDLLLSHSLADHVLRLGSADAFENLIYYGDLSQGLLESMKGNFLLLSNDTDRNKALETIDAVSKSIIQLAAIAKEALVDPSNEKLNHNAKQELRIIQSGLNILEGSLPSCLVQELIQTMAQLSDHEEKGTVIADLNGDCQKNDQAKFQKAHGAFVAERQKLGKLVRIVLNLLDRQKQELFHRIDAQNQGIESLSTSTEASTRFLFKNRNEIAEVTMKANMKSFTEKVKELRDTLISAESVFLAEDLVQGANEAFESNIAALQSAIHTGDLELAKNKRIALKFSAKHLTNIIEEEINFSSDPVYIKFLKVHSEKIEESFESIYLATNSVVLGEESLVGQSEGQKEEFLFTIKSLEIELRNLIDSIKNHKGAVDSLPNLYIKKEYKSECEQENSEENSKPEKVLINSNSETEKHEQMDQSESDLVALLKTRIKSLSLEDDFGRLNATNIYHAMETFRNLLNFSDQRTNIGKMDLFCGSLNRAAFTTIEPLFAENLEELKDFIQLIEKNVSSNNQKRLQGLKIQQEKLSQLVPDLMLEFNQRLNRSHSTADANPILVEFCFQAKLLKKNCLDQEGLIPFDELLRGAKLSYDIHSSLIQANLKLFENTDADVELAATDFAVQQCYAIFNSDRDLAIDPVYKANMESRITKSVSGNLIMTKDFASILSQIREVSKSAKKITAQQIMQIESALSLFDINVSTIATELRDQRKEQHNVQELQSAAAEKYLNAKNALDPALKALTTGIKEMVLSKEEAPVLLSPEETRMDPIKAAGQELKVEASNWSSDENPIIECMLQISKKLLELSHYHKEISLSFRTEMVAPKKAYIQTAQGIVFEVNSFIKAMQPIIEDCTDKRLKLQIQSTLSRIVTMAQQMKIIAAVKASCPGDSDAGVQIVTACKNLVASIKMAFRDAIACSIRAGKGSRLALNAIQFKKVIYARQLAGINL